MITTMPSATRTDLHIRLKRHSDGSASITLTRADGSITWQRQNGSLGAVFPPHDITHYSVETTLGYRHGFYGLVADGWNVEDFAAPWPRGEIPPEAREVEFLVGCFDTERRQLTRWSAAEFMEHGRLYAAASRSAAGFEVPSITDEQLDAVRSVRDELLGKWSALAPGDALELEFARSC